MRLNAVSEVAASLVKAGALDESALKRPRTDTLDSQEDVQLSQRSVKSEGAKNETQEDVPLSQRSAKSEGAKKEKQEDMQLSQRSVKSEVAKKEEKEEKKEKLEDEEMLEEEAMDDFDALLAEEEQAEAKEEAEGEAQWEAKEEEEEQRIEASQMSQVSEGGTRRGRERRKSKENGEGAEGEDLAANIEELEPEEMEFAAGHLQVLDRAAKRRRRKFEEEGEAALKDSDFLSEESGEEDDAEAKDDEERYKGLAKIVLERPEWKKSAVKALVKNLLQMKKVTKDELPEKPADISAELLTKLCWRFEHGIEAPLEKFARHLKPALFRRVHVGTMTYMDQSHEVYRQSFDFLETTDTWFDTDAPARPVPPSFKKLGCGFQPVSKYEALAERARDKFQVVVKVSHVATHLLKLAQFHDWWPKLYKEKYSKIAFATVAYLWQFPPNWAYSSESFEKLKTLAEYLGSPASGAPEARHIVDFRHSSWYREETYDFLRQKRWCLAWLHLNNTKGWADHLPSGWTDRVQTTDFCFCRCFGPDGPSHGSYTKAFLHELFDSCPMGTTTYVLFGNKETTEDSKPMPVPAAVNAGDFRTIFSKMDFVERVRAVRYRGDCPRVLNTEEQLLINSFYLRFSRKARLAGVTMASPVAVQLAKKYYKQAPLDKRCFEWFFPKSNRRLHLSLHDAKEDEDLWRYLRQLTGMEDIESARHWTQQAMTWRAAFGDEAEDVGDCWGKEECDLLRGTLVRFSELARIAGLLRTTELKTLDADGKLHFKTSNGDPIQLSMETAHPEQDIWQWFMDLSRVPAEELGEPELPEEADPWKDGTWRKLAGEMWLPREEPKPPEKPGAKEAEATEQTAEDNAGSWWTQDDWKQKENWKQNDSWKQEDNWKQQDKQQGSWKQEETQQEYYKKDDAWADKSSAGGGGWWQQQGNSGGGWQDWKNWQQPQGS